jgi:hypothetical protein
MVASLGSMPRPQPPATLAEIDLAGLQRRLSTQLPSSGSLGGSEKIRIVVDPKW